MLSKPEIQAQLTQESEVEDKYRLSMGTEQEEEPPEPEQPKSVDKGAKDGGKGKGRK